MLPAIQGAFLRQMARKNKLEGPIPGAGRKGKGKIKVSYKISEEAAEIVSKQTNKSAFVSEAIIAYSKH